MPKMNFKDFPITEILDFELVTIDVTKFEDCYQSHFSFFKKFKDEKGNAEGFVFIPQILGESLEEIGERIDSLIDSGFLNGINISDHGLLYNENGDEIGTVCWNSLCETFDDDLSEIDNMTALPMANTTIH